MSEKLILFYHAQNIENNQNITSNSKVKIATQDGVMKSKNLALIVCILFLYALKITIMNLPTQTIMNHPLLL